MDRGWLLAAALLFAIYCLVLLIRRVVDCEKNDYEWFSSEVSLLLIVKNQQDIIEGLIHNLSTGVRYRPVELVAMDLGSTDQTKMILERLARHRPEFKLLEFAQGCCSIQQVSDFCQGRILYRIDLTDRVDYRLMSQTIRSITEGTGVTGGSLYRTQVLYKNETPGLWKTGWNVVQ